MSWKLFIDDERFPKEEGFFIARTVSEAMTHIEMYGWPNFISFDHDLGLEHEDAIELAKFLIEADLMAAVLPADFDFVVHSANIIGGENIEALLNNYLKFKRENYV